MWFLGIASVIAIGVDQYVGVWSRWSSSRRRDWDVSRSRRRRRSLAVRAAPISNAPRNTFCTRKITFPPINYFLHQMLMLIPGGLCMHPGHFAPKTLFSTKCNFQLSGNIPKTFALDNICVISHAPRPCLGLMVILGQKTMPMVAI